MASIEEIIQSSGLSNWVKAFIAMRLTKDGLETFVHDDLKEFITNLLRSIYSDYNVEEGTTCNSCTTFNIMPCLTHDFCRRKSGICQVHDEAIPEKKSLVNCPQGICHHIRAALEDSHRFSRPSWTNTDATQWCASLNEIAKCFLASGYKDKNDLDLNAIISVIMNKKSFGLKMTAQLSSKKASENVCKKVLEMGNRIRHSANLNISDTELKDYINGLMVILSDSTCLACNENAIKALTQLKLLLKDTFIISKEQRNIALDDAIEALNRKDQDNTRTSFDNEDSSVNLDHQANLPVTEDGYEHEASKKSVDLITYTIYLRPSLNRDIGEKSKLKFVKMLKEIKNELADRGNVPISDIDTILEAKLNALEEMRKAKEENISELKTQKEEIQSEIRFQRGLQQFRPRGIIYKELRKDLSTFYRSRYNTIIISPLITEHDVQLVDLYVQPKLEYVDVTNTLEGAPADLKISSYKDLFFCEILPYQEIYVTAKAGIGKTSFVKRICMTWCQAHFPSKQLEKSFNVKDVTTLMKFDFLFMIPLKETSAKECNIDAMILHLVVNELKSKGRYSEQLIDVILRNKRVLVILDGLDEWVHPEECKQKSDVIPHRRPCSNCSVITTTRPWKLASAKLRNSQINMHAELLEFDEISSNKLVVSAVNLLNKRYRKSKLPEDFPKEVSLELLGPLRFIPYILLQVICLWYDGVSIGKSQCEIYSNALELTLSREGRIKNTCTVKSDTIPKCLSQNKTCSALYSMLLKVGKLAFEALYSNVSESNLLFDEGIVRQYLSEEDLQFILKKGLFSQNKDSSKVTSWETYFSFQHKSIQEYFAALYIRATFSENEDISEQIVQRHRNLESILEMSNVFIFLGGFNPDVCGQLLQKLKGVLSSDELCNHYRNNLTGRASSPEKRKCWEIIKSFQNMQIDIVQEVSRNGTGECHLYLEDLVLDDSLNMEMLNLLEVTVKENKDNLKSVSIEQCSSKEDIAAKFRMFQLKSSKNLQKLDITAVPSEDDLLRLLSNSERTIVSLDLCFALFKGKIYKTMYTKVSKETLSTILRMENLQSMRLNSIILPHTDVENLVTHINNKKTMTEVGLCHIRCVQHDECVMLDLSQHVNLETLRIGTIPVTLLKINGSSLKFCYTGELTTAVHIELIQRLPGAVNLKTLRLKFLDGDQSTLYTSGALAKMDQLKSFAVEIADFGQNELIIPPEMSNLERVQFYQVKMTAVVLKKFIESVSKLQQSVLVIIDDCDIISSFWTSYKRIKNRVKKMYPKYRVLFDRGKTFSFITRK